MCRIFGYLNADLTPHQMRVVSLLQRHGGPDAQQSVRGERWGVGNNRLAIVDLDGGDQPYTELDGTIQVVFNGELYNHRELRDKLRARGYTFRDTCDGSVIPALYLEYGTDFPDHLDGMYAIAVVDRREAPTLVLATDDVGMKTVYYHFESERQRFYFASEIPALLSFPGVDPRPWLPALDEYLTTKAIFGEQTAFAGIQVLPPATTAVVDGRHGLRLRQRATHPLGSEPGGFGDAAELVRTTLAREVRRLLLADVPVSTITSGGLDSSLVTAMAAEGVDGLSTFTIAYTGKWPADERPYAREVAARYRTEHHETLSDPARFPELLPTVVWHLGQPNADPITLSTHALFQHIHDTGFKVTLTGDAADELFGGYDRIREAMGAPPGNDWIDPYLESLSAVPSSLRRELYTPEYRNYLDTRAGTREYLAARLRAGARDRMGVLSAVELGLRLPAYHLRRVDHLSMAHAVEARLPFCQPAVVRLAASLPAAYKVRDGRVKDVLYTAARRYLPDSVLNRPKQPFTLPIVAMLRDGQPLMAYARDVLSTSALRRTGQLDPAAVQRLLRAQTDRPTGRSARAVWSLMVYLLWLDQFGSLDRLSLPTPTEVSR